MDAATSLPSPKIDQINHTILVVDDNPTNLEVISETLSGTAWEILVAIDGESAIAQADYARPELILLDVMMPGMDGFTTCEQLKCNPNTQHIPVIFTTALADTNHKIRGFEVGAVDYITKPFDRREVLARIRTHLRLQTLQHQLRQQNEQLQAEIRERQRVEYQLQQANAQLERLVIIDPLTQLANRRRFSEYLQASWDRLRREQQPLSLLLCDVDRFKLYNDTYGHPQGDQCLRQIARAIKCAIRRPADLAARYGGEEFAVILPNTAREGAGEVARSVQTQVSALRLVHGHAPTGWVTLSIGVATTIPTGDVSVDTLVVQADQLLYAAKAQGRNCIKTESSECPTYRELTHSCETL
jgi:diguanylate cyclase (GGDEF)-like protein